MVEDKPQGWEALPQDVLASVLPRPELFSPISPRACMELAYRAALQGAGQVATNPLVGAVMVDSQHRFLGLGAHLRYGQGHAEQNLLQELRKSGLTEHLAGASLYCTLEPCSFVGQTPACAKLMAELPLKAAICAEEDPNPRVQGRGFAILRAAGISTEVSPVFRSITRDLLAPFRSVQTRGEPYVAMKVAASVDGYIGRKDQPRLWVTNARAREFGHWLRLLYDGLVVGAGTVVVDNPRLDVRHPCFPGTRSPWRIVLDPGARALKARPLSEQALCVHAPERVLWCVGNEAWEALSEGKRQELAASAVNWLPLPLHEGAFDLKQVLGELGQRGLTSLLLEGGRGVWSSFLQAGMVQKLYLFQAPTLFAGGKDEGLLWPGVTALSSPLQLTPPRWTSLGDNWLLESSVS